MTTFDDLEFYPGDPILGLVDLYAKDEHADKVNLGVGIYLDELGRLPLPAAVKVAEQRIAEKPAPRGYIPIGGLPAFVQADRETVFGKDNAVLERTASVQTLGGSGALKEAADFLHVMLGFDQVALSSPTWGNHAALIGGAGFEPTYYRYYDEQGHRVDVDGMLEDIAKLPEGTLVILHGCCHNPTGYDLEADQWQKVAQTCREHQLMPLIDLAYQGFANGLEADRLAVNAFVESGQRFLVAHSWSKIMGLYGERVGGLSFVCQDADEAKRVHSQLQKVIRTNYSNPPTHGAQIVATVVADDELRASWLQELDGMRDRIKQMRERLVASLRAQGVDDMDFINEQNGMFSFSGLTADEMHRLRSDYGVYGTDDGRICVAGLNDQNVDIVAKAIAGVRKG